MTGGGFSWAASGQGDRKNNDSINGPHVLSEKIRLEVTIGFFCLFSRPLLPPARKMSASISLVDK